MRTTRWASVLLVAGMAAGCDGGTGSPDHLVYRSGEASVVSSPLERPTGSPDPTELPSTPVPTTGGSPSGAATAVPNPAGTLVSYGRQGGIAGIVEELRINQDGSFVITNRRRPEPKTGRLTADELASVRRALQGFEQVPAVNAGPRGADLFTYRVATGEHEVLAQDGGVPSQLKPVLSLLGGLLARYQ